MEVCDNDLFGKSLFLGVQDRLDDVPDSFAQLVSPSIREAFVDPEAYFASIAARCPFTEMSSWLHEIVADNLWRLELNVAEYGRVAGFRWHRPGMLGALVELPLESRRDSLPSALREYYSLVNEVSWSKFGWSGNLHGANQHYPLSDLQAEHYGADIDERCTFVWGSSDCGDNLIYTSDDRGGWRNHGNGQVHWLGTIADMIDWVFAKLRANRVPEWDYSNGTLPKEST